VIFVKDGHISNALGYHDLHSGMEGLPCFCPNCIAEVRSFKTAMSELTDDNKALFAQAKGGNNKKPPIPDCQTD